MAAAPGFERTAGGSSDACGRSSSLILVRNELHRRGRPTSRQAQLGRDHRRDGRPLVTADEQHSTRHRRRSRASGRRSFWQAGFVALEAGNQQLLEYDR